MPFGGISFKLRGEERRRRRVRETS